MDWLPSSGKHWRQHGADRWLVYLLGQGLGNLEDCGLAEKTQFVDPGTQIELQVRSRRPGSQDEFSLALASLWLTSVVGGVGARTRRGFGCFRILGSDVPREAAPQAPELTSVPAYTDLSGLRFDELDECCDLLMGRSVATRQPASRAGFDSTFPILDMASGDPVGTHTAATVARSGRSERWDHVLRYAGEQWRLARATTDCPDETQAFRRRKTPEWLNAAKGSSQDFPLGALGLPVVFKKGVEVNLVSGSESLRRASPVHFRPVRLGEGLGLFSFTFRSQLLPSGPGYRVTLTRPPKELRIDPQALDVRWQAWVAALAKQPPDRHPA
jgi:CRISPR-associated protein Cmr1